MCHLLSECVVSYRCLALVLVICPLTYGLAESLLPTAEGTTWNYELVQEKPSPSLDLTEPNETEQFPLSYRLGGTQKIDNQELRRLEIYRDEALVDVDLIQTDENGIVCPARMDAAGNITKINLPQPIVKQPLKTGATWSFDGSVGETKVSQRYEIVGEEDVDVSAGKFRAWRIHCEQTLPAPAMIDRWFVPGTGFVKVETAVKGPSSGLLQKTSLRLKELPKIMAPPKKNPIPQSEKFSAGLSKEPSGKFKTEFKTDTSAIYVRWRGHGLRDHAEIRALFIAESVADVSADYQIDESKAVAPKPDSNGTFTLSKPEDGWAPGSYRVEFYVEDELTQTIKLKISK